MIAQFERSTLNRMTKDELVKLGGIVGLMIEDADAVTKEDLIQQILDAQDAQAESENEQEQAASNLYEAPKNYKLKIFEQDGVGGTDDVVVGVNGFTWRIKRNVEVKVPQCVIDALENCVETRFERNESSKDIIERQVRRFSYSASPAQ